jgi:phage terminase large subunit-like protein
MGEGEKIKLLDSYDHLFTDPPLTRYHLITGGRGSGKSFHVSIFLLNLTYQPGHVILFTRWTMVSAHISIIPEFKEKIELLHKENHFEITASEIINKTTGSKILFRGIKTSQGTATANLKSIQGVTTFVVDEGEELPEYGIFEKIDLSIRAKNKPNRVIIVMNPSNKQHWIYKQFAAIHREDCTYIHTTWQDNKDNLSESFIDQAIRTQELNPLRYKHIFEGEWLDEAEGLLWNRQMIERARIEKPENHKRIVIGVDPAITANADSDETGIIVASIDNAGNGYILEDLSGRYTPLQWSAIVAGSFDRWGADCIVAEKNQGGDMVESVIRQQHKTARIKLVTATKGKYVRAEPIYSLYEQNKIYHAGHFPILENQMITFNPDAGGSPDRVDALVWAFTELMLNKAKTFVFS